MRLAWFGIFLLSFSWLRSLHVFTPPESAVWFIVAGVLLLVVSFRNHELGTMRGRQAVLMLAASLLALSWLGGSFKPGFAMLGIAAIASLVPFPAASRRLFLPGLWVSGIILVVQAACIPFLYIFSARYHATSEIPLLHDLLPGYPSLPWLEALLYVPLKLIDGGTALHGSTLFIPTNLDTLALTPTWEKLGLFPLVLFMAGAALLLALAPEWRKRLGKLALLVCLYAYARLLVLFLVVTQFRSDLAFWWSDFQVLSFLPLPFILAGLWPGNIAPSASRAPGGVSSPNERDAAARAQRSFLLPFARDIRARRVALAAILFAGGSALFWGYHDPGVHKQGRILIDERHSDWEWTTQPFDTTWYGGKSGYNYYCLADYWNHFYRVETRTDSLTAELLSQWDVLVVKTPTAPFAPDEIDAIERFVREGGGLFLIGDHTNVFGTSTYLNSIAERFGMYFRYDATYNLINLGLNLYLHPRRFAHPVVQSMPAYLFATSCSMYSPLLSENVILGYGLRGMYLDYSEKSYFPVKAGKMNYDFGLFVQAGGVKHGKGRVLGYTDSTCFSNFFMFIPGKPELALGSIEWLNRANRWAWLGKLFLLAALAGFVLLIAEGRRNSGMQFWNTAAMAGTLAMIVAGSFCERAAVRSYPLPKPHTPPAHVTFDQGHGSYVLPIYTIPINDWRNFHTFYVWTQRLGIVPRNEYSLRRAVQDSKALVEIHPAAPFSIEEIDAVVDFVRKGGTLIVIDSPANENSTANQILGPFMMAFDGEAAESTAVFDMKGDTLGIAREAFGVAGGNPLYELGDGRPVMTYTNMSKGKVVAFGASYLFSSEYMGSTAVVPSAAQRRIYRAEFELFGTIAGIEAGNRYGP